MRSRDGFNPLKELVLRYLRSRYVECHPPLPCPGARSRPGRNWWSSANTMIRAWIKAPSLIG